MYIDIPLPTPVTPEACVAPAVPGEPQTLTLALAIGARFDAAGDATAGPAATGALLVPVMATDRVEVPGADPTPWTLTF